MSDGRGNTYVNNIGFDFPDGEFAPGLIALVSPDGTVRQVAEDLAFPNGMAVTPDNSTLIVAESYGGVLTAYDIAPDGDLSKRRVWAELDGAAPDGICIDAEGAVWFAEVPGRRCVRVREGGEVLQTISSELGCFACMLGGPDGTTLFVTAAAWPDAMTPGSRTGQISYAPRLSGCPARAGLLEGSARTQPGMRPSSDSLSSCRTSSSVESAAGKIRSESSSSSSGNRVPVVRIRSSSACSALVS